MEKMYECTFKENYNRCRFLNIAGGEYLCSALEDGCGFRAAAAVPGASMVTTFQRLARAKR